MGEERGMSEPEVWCKILGAGVEQRKDKHQTGVAEGGSVWVLSSVHAIVAMCRLLCPVFWTWV